MNKRKARRIKKKILNNQGKYKKLREKARFELTVLEEYFGKSLLDELTIYYEIKKHLEANQKEISYFGLRGVIVGLATAIFVYLFNSQIIPNLGQLNLGKENQIFSYILNQIGAIFAIIIFLVLYFITTADFFIADWKRRNQIYINEYMIKLVEEKIVEINDIKK
ncbi:hypothetical protein P5G62_015230 [Neobacillus sp. 179-C4.2 HS]|uniref:DUF2663 family protein n=1 Tax=Neobacillus driksii TaxID=3035913 RepID=A0ABV4YUD9_9BACI|nr:hypothetical protein [Neobacillus sp. 179.-C4.2 HS]MDP5192765.1 hypothetical protein [Neobacillus sp. 179.-C4.2 HS]